MYFLHNKVLRYEIEWRKCLLAMNNVTFNKLMNDIKCEVYSLCGLSVFVVTDQVCLICFEV